jgi:hypothetical protein
VPIRWFFLQIGGMKRGDEKRCKCLCCRRVFTPDYRNKHHQCFCGRLECRQASRQAAQKRWRRKPENRAYFCGSHYVQRTQQWRRKNPRYWKKKSPAGLDLQPSATQTVNTEQTSCNATMAAVPPLQDVCWERNPIIVGLVALLTGHTLQEDIAITTRKLIDQGRNILGLGGPINNNPNLDYDRKTSDPTGAVAAHPAEL